MITPKTNLRPRAELLSDRILALFLAAPEYAERIIEALMPEMLSTPAHAALYGKLVECYTGYNSQGSPSGGADFRQFWHSFAVMAAPELLSTADDPSSRAALTGRSNILELYGDKEFDNWTDREFTREVDFLCAQIKHEHARARRDALAAQMREAEGTGNSARVAELTREFAALSE